MALSERITRACERVERLEPRIHALLPEPARRERLLREAAALESAFPASRPRPPLFGTLLGVKDIFRVDGFPTRAGSTLPPELFDGPEASVVTRLRQAGALVLGKTVTTEFAYFEPGPTRNPRAPAHTPGGSSSGSAAAVAAGYCELALGTQTVGSVIRPAAFCGVVGFKPTYGRVPADGVIPFAPSVDHVGFCANAVSALQSALAAVVDGWTGSGSAPPPVLGVPAGPYLEQTSPEGREGFEAGLRLLRDAGCEVRVVPALGEIQAINRRHQRLIAAEMAAVHAEWFARFAERYRPRTAALIREGMTVCPEEAECARAGRDELRRELECAMEEHGIDLWVSPAATGPAPAGIESTGSPAMNLPWTHAGLPAVTLPAGTAANGLPFGVQFAARAGADEALVTWAGELARVLGSDE